MRQRVKRNSESGAGAEARAPDPSAGGERVCYLPLLDDDGTLAEPRHLVAEYEPGVERVVDLSPGAYATDHPAPELIPLPGESVADYASRLQRPAERTAAWKLALAAPIAIRLDGNELAGHRATVITYVRELLS